MYRLYQYYMQAVHFAAHTLVPRVGITAALVISVILVALCCILALGIAACIVTYMIGWTAFLVILAVYTAYRYGKARRHG